MTVIYEPKGKAREYSQLALNIYNGCSYQCKYCYAPRCLRMDPNDYFKVPIPKKDIVGKVAKELEKGPVPDKLVMLSFNGDPYCETADRGKTTRDILIRLLQYQVPVAILSKGGKRILEDLDLFQRFDNIQVGLSLTLSNAWDSAHWERGASRPHERIWTLDVLHNTQKGK